MTVESRLTIHKGMAAVAALALLFAGAGVMYLVMRNSRGTTESSSFTAPDLSPVTTSDVPANTPLPDVVVPLSQEAVQRAGLVVSPVTSGALNTTVRLPGVVEPNAYTQVVVTPLVTGRITRVSVALGDRVRRGQTMAHIYSPELADAQTLYISARAMLDAHERELQRTHKLADIGAASRQELERIHAEHESQTAAVETARSRLELLGMPTSAIQALASGNSVNAVINVPAPSDGIVTERAGNAGLNVEPATKLFTVADLSTVWVVADVYEKDLSQVRVGTDASIGASALPQVALSGRVSYIDPQISTETRTAKVRIEVPNPRGELRFGMYVDVTVITAGPEGVPTISRRAVQNVGNRTVVYIADPKTSGSYIEREVHLGAVSGEQVEVTAGLSPGDRIVTDGSFFVRAERERLGLRGTGTSGSVVE
jgi:RND family efflux transporter MFP subunit